MTNPIPRDEYPEEPDHDDDLLQRLATKSIWGKFGWEPDEDAREAAARIRVLREERDAAIKALRDYIKWLSNDGT